MSRSSKGSKFERDTCKQLSLWWTKGKRDDIFWRTAGSGAMAKVRSKVGKRTFGQYGDIQAIDPIGQPLIDQFSIELKRGYATSTFADLVETSTHQNPNPGIFEKHIEQAIQDKKNAKTKTWLLIVKRDRRKAVVCMKLKTFNRLKDLLPELSSFAYIAYSPVHLSGVCRKLVIFHLEDFLEINPEHLK